MNFFSNSYYLLFMLLVYMSSLIKYLKIIYYMTIGKSVPIHFGQTVCIISPIGSKQDHFPCILNLYYRYFYAF